MDRRTFSRLRVAALTLPLSKDRFGRLVTESHAELYLLIIVFHSITGHRRVGQLNLATILLGDLREPIEATISSGNKVIKLRRRLRLVCDKEDVRKMRGGKLVVWVDPSTPISDRDRAPK